MSCISGSMSKATRKKYSHTLPNLATEKHGKTRKILFSVSWAATTNIHSLQFGHYRFVWDESLFKGSIFFSSCQPPCDSNSFMLILFNTDTQIPPSSPSPLPPCSQRFADLLPPARAAGRVVG